MAREREAIELDPERVKSFLNEFESIIDEIRAYISTLDDFGKESEWLFNPEGQYVQADASWGGLSTPVKVMPIATSALNEAEIAREQFKNGLNNIVVDFVEHYNLLASAVDQQVYNDDSASSDIQTTLDD